MKQNKLKQTNNIYTKLKKHSQDYDAQIAHEGG
jgi:hypothetical protein